MTGANFGHKVLGSFGEAASSLNRAETSEQHQCYGYSISEILQGPQIPTSLSKYLPQFYSIFLFNLLLRRSIIIYSLALFYFTKSNIL